MREMIAQDLWIHAGFGERRMYRSYFQARRMPRGFKGRVSARAIGEISTVLPRNPGARAHGQETGAAEGLGRKACSDS